MTPYFVLHLAILKKLAVIVVSTELEYIIDIIEFDGSVAQ